MVRGTLAAALTPLRDDGAALDEDALGPYLDFLAAGGLDGILALGTTGEGILLSAAEFLDNSPEGDIRELLSGHLCRCTGYEGIVAAIKEVAAR